MKFLNPIFQERLAGFKELEKALGAYAPRTVKGKLAPIFEKCASVLRDVIEKMEKPIEEMADVVGDHVDDSEIPF